MQESQTTQAQLVQSAKLASIGTLASGVAHEMDNPLFVIQGRAELLLEHQERHLVSERSRQYVQAIHEQVMRASQIVKDLLLFARSSVPKEPVQLADIIDKTLGLVGKSITTSNIQIEKDYGVGLPPVDVIPNQIQQVFLNLVQNARDAMSEGAP